MDEKEQKILERYMKLFRDAGDTKKAHELHARNMMTTVRLYRQLLDTNKSVIELIDLMDKKLEPPDEQTKLLGEIRDKLNEATITFERSLRGRIGFIWDEDQ